MRSLAKGILSILAVVISLLLLFAYFSTSIPPQKLHGFNLLWYAMPYLWLANLTLLIVRIFIGNTFTFLIQIVAILLTSPGAYVTFSFINTHEEKRADISVLTYNVRELCGSDESGRIEVKDLVELVQKENADIVCLQEMPMGLYLQTTGKAQSSDVAKEFGYKYSCASEKYGLNSLVILSRYPLHRVKIQKSSLNGYVLMAEADVDGKKLNVLNCHLQSNSLTNDEITAVNKLKNFDAQKHENEVRSTYRKLSKSSLVRSVQVDDLAEYISHLKHRTIVCGDFNDIPTSYTYHQISANLSDAFVGSGAGVGDTYNGKLPPLRIDYIFFSSKVDVIDYAELDVMLSDHYPVKASFALLN
ncbi:MAG: hypothetical protein E7069_05445 [Bacteroidales bacterium]|jgi:endonuclease/exonuclease/phosphatase family metal-dependent hydrolase|nr:hypothetical protein [Bacteroidales bacterium]